MRTLARPLLLGLLLVTAGTAAVSTWVSWHAARTEVDELLDAELAQSVRELQVLMGVLAEVIEDADANPHELPVWQGPMEAIGAASAGAAGHAYERERVLYGWLGDRLLLHSQDAPTLASLQVSPGFGELMLDGQRWRSFRIDAGNGAALIGLEPLQLRTHVTAQIARSVLWPLLIELPLLALLIWAVVLAGSRSLRRIARAVSSQAGDALQPIDRARIPLEVHGLVDAIDALLSRVDVTLRRERRFIDEAAHELRTPVAALRLHLSNLEDAEDAQARGRSLAQVRRAQTRLERSVGQLLDLSRLGPGAPAPRHSRVDLSACLPDWLAEWIDAGLAADDELELRAASGCVVKADPVQLQLLLRNLVDNALRHGGRPAQVRIEVSHRSGGGVRLTVDDAGPGLSEEEHGRVLDPFYRPLGTRADGSGLGLSIVARVASLANAELSFGQSPLGGLRVALVFPAPG